MLDYFYYSNSEVVRGNNEEVYREIREIRHRKVMYIFQNDMTLIQNVTRMRSGPLGPRPKYHEYRARFKKSSKLNTERNASNSQGQGQEVPSSTTDRGGSSYWN